jgi:hypothetical protein
LLISVLSMSVASPDFPSPAFGRSQIASRQARQEHEEEQDETGLALGGLGVFPQDMILFVVKTCIVPPRLSGKDFQLLRVSSADFLGRPPAGSGLSLITYH